MSIVPFRWLGASRLACIRSALCAQAAAWAQAWSSSTSALQGGEIQALCGEDIGHHWYVARGPHGTAMLGFATGGFDTLGCRLVGAYAADTQGFAAGLGRQALSEFLCRMVGNSDNVLIESDSGAAVLDPRQGSAAFLWSLSGLRIAIHLDASLCAHIAPPDSTHGTALVERREAIQPEQVTLQATLDLGCTDLASTSTLRPGDVIRTRIGLDAQLRLCAGDSDIASATLIASDGRRALRVASTQTNRRQ
jgi:hypothetical protein